MGQLTIINTHNQSESDAEFALSELEAALRIPTSRNRGRISQLNIAIDAVGGGSGFGYR